MSTITADTYITAHDQVTALRDAADYLAELNLPLPPYITVVDDRVVLAWYLQNAHGRRDYTQTAAAALIGRAIGGDNWTSSRYTGAGLPVVSFERAVHVTGAPIRSMRVVVVVADSPDVPLPQELCQHDNVTRRVHGEQWGDATTHTCQDCGWEEVA